jgi:BirA family biotin operon repressor/biotin-[acetyl-CoA-carboxylase] ligase
MELTAIHKKLIKRLADGQFYSGQQLANELGVSRTSIWNYLKTVEEAGFELHPVKGKGTRFAAPVELLDKDCIADCLPKQSKRLLKQLIMPDVCSSTNQYLLQQNSVNSLPSGSVCITEMQTAGKGRLGRTWVSPYGQNLYLSFLWRFRSGISSLAGLSLACGVAVCDTLKQLGLEEHGLKWPNDILWNDKKLGGILVEIHGENQGDYIAIIGIGINHQMNKKPSDDIDQPWVDISQAHQGKLGRNKLAAHLMGSVLEVLNDYEEGGLAPYVGRWNAFDCYKNRKVQISSGKAITKGVANGITKTGELKLLKKNGETQLVSSGEVSLRLSKN